MKDFFDEPEKRGLRTLQCAAVLQHLLVAPVGIPNVVLGYWSRVSRTHIGLQFLVLNSLRAKDSLDSFQFLLVPE